ncbi:hypothetical protein DIPPA_53702 [Diplonema papillatum]|nr:hypothetical protein DIPPA_53702 [Diplonema papillatum]
MPSAGILRSYAASSLCAPGPPPPTSQVQRLSATGRDTSMTNGSYAYEAQMNVLPGATPAMTTSSADARSWADAVRPSTGSELARDSAPMKELNYEHAFAATTPSRVLDTEFLLTLPQQIQASLKTFEELQSQKPHILSSSAKLSSSRSPQVTPPQIGLRSASTGRLQGPPGVSAANALREQSRREKENLRKLQIAESVMKKLHKKNQKLAKEVTNLRGELAGGSVVNREADITDDSAGKRLQQKDSLIEILESKLKAAERSLSSSTHGPLSTSRSQPSVSAFEDRFERLQQQYSDLLTCRVDNITNGASTAKINKDVKAFFVALRKKIHADMLTHEVERIVWNEQMANIEEELCERSVAKRCEGSTS